MEKIGNLSQVIPYTLTTALHLNTSAFNQTIKKSLPLLNQTTHFFSLFFPFCSDCERIPLFINKISLIYTFPCPLRFVSLSSIGSVFVSIIKFPGSDSSLAPESLSSSFILRLCFFFSSKSLSCFISS